MREGSRHLFIPRRLLIASMLASDPERSWIRIVKASLISSTRSIRQWEDGTGSRGKRLHTLRPLAPVSMLLGNGAQMRPPVQPTRTPARRQSVEVVGGGFAGLNLIQHLRDAPVNIVLIDRSNHHLFSTAAVSYQVATAALAPTEIAEPTRSILRNARNVTVRLDEVIGYNIQVVVDAKHKMIVEQAMGGPNSHMVHMFRSDAASR
jgi:Pyridine nucleotide-disulphide oxidoreductase